jgi:hypothetical protein
MPPAETDHLPPDLQARLSADTALARADRAFLICTVDGDGRPHPSMLSAFEVTARDAATLRLGTYASSRTSRHLAEDGRVTLMVVEPGAVYYVKGRARRLAASLACAPGVAKFEVRVEHVRADAADVREGAVGVVDGIRIARAAVQPAEVQAMLAELLED